MPCFSLADETNPFKSVAGRDTIRLTIQDAIFLALERNPTVTIQRLDPKIKQSYASEQRSVFDPMLSASAQKTKSKSQRFLGSRPDPFEMTTDRTQYNLEISETLPTGSTLALVSSFSGSGSNIYTDQYVGSMGVTFSQALLQGISWGANLAELRRTRLDVEISRSELKGVAEQVVADVETAYWSLYLAAQEILIQRKSLELAEKQLQESLERVTVGKLPELELAAVHAEVSTRHEALIDAQSRYEQARLQMLFFLNPSHKDFWSLTPDLVDVPLLPIDSLGAISLHDSLGLRYRSDLQQADYNLKKGELEITRTRNGLLPRLDLFISFGRTAYAKTFNEGLPDPTSPFYDFSMGLNFEFPVINRTERAQVARARWTQEQNELALENMKRLVEWDVRSAYIEVLRTRKLIETTKVTLALQEKKLAAELEKFRVGKSTNYLVLQAQRDLTASQLEEARAVVSYLNALIQLYRMEGTLLERRGISNPAE
ncbi:TolC family protein [candidate division KSB1 bacterium]|nr:TolC family protein [candidate division KSB1 bacterium]